MNTQINEVYGKLNADGNVSLLYANDGYPVTRLDTAGFGTLYPVDSDVSTCYEHPEGIVVTLSDCHRLKIDVENKIGNLVVDYNERWRNY
ncbi:hypothetical protein A9G10_05995 [Gilliamella sp. wkB308]|nr:hypothetical protein A9G10_05995 [Gilliamella apicola]